MMAAGGWFGNSVFRALPIVCLEMNVGVNSEPNKGLTKDIVKHTVAMLPFALSN